MSTENEGPKFIPARALNDLELWVQAEAFWRITACSLMELAVAELEAPVTNRELLVKKLKQCAQEGLAL